VRADPAGERRARAGQEADSGRRGSGYVFGAFRPATGEACTAPFAGRTIANWGAFLEQGDDSVPAAAERVYAVLANLSAHRALDVLLWARTHPRWECVCQPTYAASRNLIEPWRKVLRSLALKGRRFATWEEGCGAIAQATASWNRHRHPCVWGKRKRRRAARRTGLAQLPLAA
jgi:hypothetical protein